jgi:hypothetical protein
MEFTQKAFDGCINQLSNDTELADNEYRLLINGRQRHGRIQPVKKSTIVTGLPAGNHQALISVGNTLVAFVAGLAYYRVHGTTVWIQISGFAMDATARRLWTIAVPKSSRDYVRYRDNSMNNPIIINTDFNVAGNPAGIVVQDGLNQPWLIQFNAVSQTFIARETKTYAQWANTSVTADDREYVPIGKQMFFLNEKLYVLAPDSKSIYQSVTGRPLDFMVNVDNAGNKLAAEAQGGASSVSFAFDSDDITIIKDVNITDTFIYGTAKTVRLITLDYNNTILGEPTYRRAQILDVGILNDQCLVDVLGDYCFTDNDGIKSFNAVQNYRVEGKNSIFSAQIDRLISPRVQVTNLAAAIGFDNYGLFYVNTRYGRGIAVYDTLRPGWVSLDITEIQEIKQFCVLANGAVNILYAVTADAIWEMYTSDSRETAQLHLKSLMPDNVTMEHKGHWVKPIFRGATMDGRVEVQEYVDEQYSTRELRDTTNSVMAMKWPLIFPVGFNSLPNAYNNAVIVDKGLGGKKIAYVILWNTDAALHTVKVVTSEQEAVSALQQNATS